MVRPERQRTICDLVLERGRLSVAELSRRFGVTGMTIRRDLAALEEEGAITRTHGGCVPAAGAAMELPFAEKEGRGRPEKRAIAREAVSRLPEEAAVYLDTGTTAAEVARLLPAHRRLHVFTNNLQAALELQGREGVRVTVYGGELGRRSPDLTGEAALAQLRQVRVDLAVVGADGVDPERGEFYAADLATATLSRAAQAQAGRVLACIDSSKFGTHGRALAGRLGDGVTLVTDSRLSRAHRRALRRLPCEVVCARVV